MSADENPNNLPPTSSSSKNTSHDNELLEDRCPICLGKFEDKSYVNTCLHKFCFHCLWEWMQVKIECPLCKQGITSVFHNVRADDDYCELIVRRRQNSRRSSVEELSMSGAPTALASGPVLLRPQETAAAQQTEVDQPQTERLQAQPPCQYIQLPQTPWQQAEITLSPVPPLPTPPTQLPPTPHTQTQQSLTEIRLPTYPGHILPSMMQPIRWQIADPAQIPYDTGRTLEGWGSVAGPSHVQGGVQWMHNQQYQAPERSFDRPITNPNKPVLEYVEGCELCAFFKHMNSQHKRTPEVITITSDVESGDEGEVHRGHMDANHDIHSQPSTSQISESYSYFQSGVQTRAQKPRRYPSSSDTDSDN